MNEVTRSVLQKLINGRLAEQIELGQLLHCVHAFDYNEFLRIGQSLLEEWCYNGRTVNSNVGDDPDKTIEERSPQIFIAFIVEKSDEMGQKQIIR